MIFTPLEIFNEFNQSKLARDLNVTRATVTNWRANRKIPAERVVEVAKLTGICKTRLRPDLYS